jgi:uncharacterized protein YjbJ (UPF0337 family)
MSSDNSNPSMLSGHAQYAKGYVEETIGNVTGSKEWQEGGKSDTQAGIDEMKVSSSSSSALGIVMLDILSRILLPSSAGEGFMIVTKWKPNCIENSIKSIKQLAILIWEMSRLFESMQFDSLFTQFDPTARIVLIA